MIADHISNDLQPQMKFYNMVIPILIHFFTCLPLKSLFHLKLECCKLHVIQLNAPGSLAQLVVCLIADPGVLSLI